MSICWTHRWFIWIMCSSSNEIKGKEMNFYLWIHWLRQKRKARYGHVLLIIEKFCFCLFVCFVPLENFSLIWRRHHGRWRAANFDLCSALMAIEQRVFFSVPPHLLWHEASVYNGQLRRPATPTPIAERLAAEVPLPTTFFYEIGLSRLGIEHPTFRLWGHRSNPLCHCRGLIMLDQKALEDCSYIYP